MSMSSLTAALFAVFAFVYPLTSQAATLQIDGLTGQLLGADGVDVGGALYDVDFLEGTCVALFSGCDASEDFTFSTEVTALAAANALQAQVFLDGPAGMFDSTASLTNGCEDASCSVFTPFSPVSSIQVQVAVFENIPGPADGGAFTQNFINILDTTGFSSVVYASWAISEATVVPLPATGLLFLSGLAGLFFVKRRQTPNAA